MKEIKVKFRAEILHDEEGYSVSVPTLPGCHTQGGTLEEAKANASEAIRLYLEVVEELHGIEGINEILARAGAEPFDVEVNVPIRAHA